MLKAKEEAKTLADEKEDEAKVEERAKGGAEAALHLVVLGYHRPCQAWYIYFGRYILVNITKNITNNYLRLLCLHD
jgi:hypothetical protein